MSEEKKEKKLYPGDVGYPGGTTHTTIYVDGRAKDMTVVKDAYGNVVFVGITNKIFGIF